MPSNTINTSQPQYMLPMGPALPAGVKPVKTKKMGAPNPLARGPKVTIQGAPKTVRPMSEYGAKVVKGFVSLFSVKTFKALGANGAKIGAGLAGGAVLAIFAGPQIHAAFVGLAASSVFPPVAIAVGATLGAAILAFGIYKLVQWGKAKLKAEAEVRAALAQEAQYAQQGQYAQEPVVQVPPQYASTVQQDSASYKAPSEKSKAPSTKSSMKAPSVAKSAAKAYVPTTGMAGLPELDEEATNAWGKETKFNN